MSETESEKYLIQNSSLIESSENPRSIDEYYETAYNKNNQRMPFYMMMLSLGIANSGDATELSCMNYLLANDRFKNDILKGDVKIGGALLAGAVFGGMIIGGLLTGVLGDRLGRRPLLLSGLGLNSICGVLSCLSPNIYFLFVLRFFSGLGIGAIISSLITLTSESSPPSKRGFFGAFVISFWTMGTIYMALLAKIMFGVYTISWRFFMVGAAIPIVVAFFMVSITVPESAKYLALADRHSEAAKAANRIGTYLGYSSKKLQVEELHYLYPPNIETVRIAKEKSMREHIADFFHTLSQIYSKQFLVRSIILQFIMCCIAFGNGLTVWINTIYVEIGIEDPYIHLIYFSLSNIPGNIAAALLLDVLGRKRLLIISLLLSAVSLFAGSMVASAEEPDKNLFSFCVCCYHAFVVMVFSSVYILGCEIYPTTLRGTGMGVATAFSRFAAMFVQFLYGPFVKQPAIIFIIGGTALLFGACAVTCLGPDTANKPLSDSHIVPTSANTSTDLDNRSSFSNVGLKNEML